MVKFAGNFEIDEHGLVKAEIGIRAHAGYKDRVKHLLNRAARAAEVTMKLTAPDGPRHKSTGGFERAIGRERAEFRFGGAGGGGSYVAIVGVQRTAETIKGGYSYPTNVFQGTGIYGPKGTVIKAAPGNVMRIENYKTRDVDLFKGKVLSHVNKEPGVIFTKTVKGQPPQRAWYEAGRERARLIISSNQHRIFNIHDPLNDI